MSANGTVAEAETINPRLANGVVVLLLLILNIVGNGLVYYVYNNYFKKNIFTLFVKVLAVLDLLTAVTTMLIDVMVKVRPLDEDKLNLFVMCKVSHFAVYSSHLLCVCVLTFISYQRYMKVCHPLKPGFDLRQAKMIIIFSGVCCAVLCIFVLVIMGPHDVQVEVRKGTIVNVTICRFEEPYDGHPTQKAFSYILFAIFLVALTSMFVFYILIARELKRFEKRNSDVLMSMPTTPEARSSNSSHDLRHHSSIDTTAVLNTRMGHGDKISIHMYKVFAIITIIFTLSYLPHLVVLILQEVIHLDHRVLTYGQRAMLEMAYNSPYISSMANPIVYGFSNAEFREHCRDLLTCKKWRRRKRNIFYG